MLRYFMRRLITGLCLYGHNLFLPAWEYVERARTYTFEEQRLICDREQSGGSSEIDRYVAASFSAAV